MTCSVQKCFKKNCRTHRKHLCQSFFFKRPSIYLKKPLRHRYYPVNFVAFSRTLFLWNNFGGCFWPAFNEITHQIPFFRWVSNLVDWTWLVTHIQLHKSFCWSDASLMFIRKVDISMIFIHILSFPCMSATISFMWKWTTLKLDQAKFEAGVTRRGKKTRSCFFFS